MRFRSSVREEEAGDVGNLEGEIFRGAEWVSNKRQSLCGPEWGFNSLSFFPENQPSGGTRL